MKITLLGPSHPFRGGIAAFSDRLALELMSEGHDVDIITFTTQYPSILFPGKTQFNPEAAPAGLKVRRMMSSVNPLSWIKTGKKIKKEAPDLLIVKFWMPFMAPCLGTIARIARSNGKTRVVANIDNLIPHEHRPGDNVLIKYFCGSVDSFVAMCKSVLTDIELFDKAKPKAMSPHPLYDHFGEKVSREEACAHLGLNPADKHLLFFGLIRDYKGLDLLIQAYPSVADKAKLIVAGEFYSGEERYHSMARELGIDDKIIWHTRYIPDSQVKYYFCAADLIVQPYKSATQSGVTQIAYHFGKPMLVTDVGGLSEIVPDGKVGYVVKPEAEPIAEALKAYLKETPDFSAGIEEEKKRYSWSAMTRTLLSFSE